MWSAGLIGCEMVRKRALCKGDSQIGQLFAIFSCASSFPFGLHPRSPSPFAPSFNPFPSPLLFLLPPPLIFLPPLPWDPRAFGTPTVETWPEIDDYPEYGGSWWPRWTAPSPFVEGRRGRGAPHAARSRPRPVDALLLTQGVHAHALRLQSLCPRPAPVPRPFCPFRPFRLFPPIVCRCVLLSGARRQKSASITTTSPETRGEVPSEVCIHDAYHHLFCAENAPENNKKKGKARGAETMKDQDHAQTGCGECVVEVGSEGGGKKGEKGGKGGKTGERGGGASLMKVHWKAAPPTPSR